MLGLGFELGLGLGSNPNPTHQVKQRRHLPRAGAAERVAERDGASERVDLVRVRVRVRVGLGLRLGLGLGLEPPSGLTLCMGMPSLRTQ